MTRASSVNDQHGAAAPAAHAVHETTRSATTRVLGILTIAGFALLGCLAFWWTPEDAAQGNAVRILYIHPPLATMAYLSCFACTAGSVMFLIRRSRWWDTVAHAAAEVGSVFMALVIASGALWGKATWGVYWVWDDARLVSSGLLFVLLLGYLALRKVPGDPDVRAKRAAWLGILVTPNVFLVRWSVEWWRTLHQRQTLEVDKAHIEGLMLFALFTGFVVLALTWVWFMIHRFRVAWLEGQLDRADLDAALVARRTEARTAGTGAARFDAPGQGDPI